MRLIKLWKKKTTVYKTWNITHKRIVQLLKQLLYSLQTTSSSHKFAWISSSYSTVSRVSLIFRSVKFNQCYFALKFSKLSKICWALYIYCWALYNIPKFELVIIKLIFKWYIAKENCCWGSYCFYCTGKLMLGKLLLGN